MKIELFSGCESAWNLSVHRCGIWMLASSSDGKDNALAIQKAIIEHCQEQAEAEFPRHKFACFNILDVGRMTYAGLLTQLDDGISPDKNHFWMTWVNSELSQCLGKGSNDIQEKDFCQLAEGVPVGKRVALLCALRLFASVCSAAIR